MLTKKHKKGHIIKKLLTLLATSMTFLYCHISPKNKSEESKIIFLGKNLIS